MNVQDNINNLLELQRLRAQFMLSNGASSEDVTKDVVINQLIDAVEALERAHPVAILNPNVRGAESEAL